MNRIAKHNFHILQRRDGFSLLELLVVIAIIATIIAVAVPNFVGARLRARDARKKEGLRQLKNALQIYYNDYQQYPATDVGLYLDACGTNGDTRCPVCSTADFAAGGVDGCDTVYMRRFPMIGTTQTFRYYGCAGGDDFRIKIDLENPGDQSITESQTRCPVGCGTTYSAQDFVMCAD